MLKRANNKALCLTLVLSFVLVSFVNVHHLMAANEPTDVGPTVVAPGRLSDQERAELETQYTYEVRHKDRILSPFTGAGGVPMGVPAEPRNEQEKLYRYFGVAETLREENRYDEAIEILEYILYVDPTDKYVQNYLKRVRREARTYEVKWKSRTEHDAAKLRKEKLRDLQTEGKAYYKQKQYDMALVRFNDMLALDPDNRTAKSYIKRLKKHYTREIEAANIARTLTVEGTEAGSASGQASGKMADEELGVVLEDREDAAAAAEAEMEMLVESIIAQHMVEEQRARFYQLGPGDVVEVSVRDHPELSGTVQVNVKGDIALPLTNDVVRADGFTLDEFIQGATQAMEKYVDDPNISATIVGYNSKIFYVVDEGGVTPYKITRANFTVKDALFASDWGTNRALGRVQVIKPSVTEPIIKDVNAFDIIYKGDMSENMQIADGDIIYVPLTIARKFTEVITDSLSPVNATQSLRNEWIDMRWNREDGWNNLGRIPRNRSSQEQWDADVGNE